MSKQTDWIAIESAYRAGTKSIRSIAEEHGITEGTIRARAKKLGWTRDAEKTKREIVRSRMATGVTQGVTQKQVRNIIETEAEQDVLDMQSGLDVQRECLSRLKQMVFEVDSPRDVKVIAEAAKIAVETIRRIRGLDEPGVSDDALKNIVVEFVKP